MRKENSMKLRPGKLLSVLTHRATAVGFSLIIQVAAIILVLHRFSDYFLYFYIPCFLLSLVVVLVIINKPVDPGYKIAWIVPILLLPLFGGVLYFYLGASGLSRRTKEKIRSLQRGMAEALTRDRRAIGLSSLGKDAVNQCRYLETVAHSSACTGTEITYYPLGDKLFQPFLEALQGAKRYIFLEFYIVTPGKFWNAVLAVLEEKVREGVEVRLIYDDVGCLLSLPLHYPKFLEEKGIHCRVFNRLKPVPSVRLNNRDHRKICVIDGHTAFTGGFNLADEYINEVVLFGHWKDSGLRLRGEAAWPLTVMFLTMWEFVDGGKEDPELWRPRYLPQGTWEKKSWVLPYTDIPLDAEPVGETVYRNLVSKAKDYVYLTTPYLIPNTSLNDALCSAARSGVDVRIITPHIPDRKTIFEATQAHYLPLLEAGVRIFEYTPGFLHAKNWVCDDLYATVGTINLDYRSLFLNFENGVWLCNDPAVLDVKQDFLETMAVSHEITLAEARDHRLPRLIFRSILRVFSPLM